MELTVVCVYVYPSGLNEGKMYQSWLSARALTSESLLVSN